MSMYSLIQYSKKYSKSSRILWQYYRDEPNDNIAKSESFQYKKKIAGETSNADN